MADNAEYSIASVRWLVRFQEEAKTIRVIYVTF